LFPLILSWYGESQFTHAMFIYTFFSAAGALTLGIPIYLTRKTVLQEKKKGEEWRYFYLAAIALLLYSIILLWNFEQYYYLILFIPVLSYVSARRGIEEGERNFFKSAILRLLFFVITPVALIFSTFENPYLGLIVALVTVLFFVVFFHKNTADVLLECFKDSLLKFRAIKPYAMQSLYVFLFIFLDRSLLWLINPSIEFSIFSYEYEFIYRAIMPFTIILIVLFPYMFKANTKKNINRKIYILLIAILIFYSVLMQNIETVYEFITLEITSGIYESNNFLVSTLITALCLGAFLQRKAMTIKDEERIFRIFLILSIAVSISGICATFLFDSAIAVLSVKITVEILIFWYFFRFNNVSVANE